MKKNKRQLFTDNTDDPTDNLVWELKETEKEFTESLEKYWEHVAKKTKLQRSVFKTAHRLSTAKKVLRVIGDLPKSIN